MNKTRRRIADYILEYPEKCSFFSLKEISEHTGTTQVTLLSFCRDLGYKNYIELKQELQSSLIAKVEARDRIKLVHSASRDEMDMYDQLVRSTHQMIDSTYENNSVDVLMLYAKKLASAKHVFVVAHNFTSYPARIFTSNLIYENIDARFLNIENREEVFSVLTAHPASECLLFAFGVSPCGKSTLSIAEFCRGMGMEVLSITDKATSQLAACSSHSMICNIRSMSLFNSLTSIIMMIDVLMVFVAAESEARGSLMDEKEAARLRDTFKDYPMG